MEPVNRQNNQRGAAPRLAAKWRVRAPASLGGLAWILLAIVLGLTLGPNLPRPHLFLEQDKAEHLIAFGLVSFCFGWGSSALAIAGSGFGLALCAVAIELFQALFSPSRTGAASDALAGVLGIVVGLGLALVISSVLSRSRPTPARA